MRDAFSKEQKENYRELRQPIVCSKLSRVVCSGRHVALSSVAKTFH